MYYIENLLEKMIVGLTPLRENLVSRRLKREDNLKRKRFIKKNPIFKNLYNRALDENVDRFIKNIINDDKAVFLIDHYRIHYYGKHGYCALWTANSNYPYSYGHVAFYSSDDYTERGEYADYNTQYKQPSSEMKKALFEFIEELRSVYNVPYTENNCSSQSFIVDKRQHKIMQSHEAYMKFTKMIGKNKNG